jgi:hypothetical protein
MVKKGNDMNTTLITNQRLVTILLVLLIIFVVLLIIGIVIGFLMTGGMMDGWMMGISGQTMNDMMSACTDFMRNIQSP